MTKCIALDGLSWRPGCSPHVDKRARDGITINMFLLPSWSQSEEDIRFAYRLAESTKGRVFFTAGNDLDRYVVWDYVNRKREIIS